MAESIKRTFSLTAEQAAFIDGKVEQGGFKSASEVVRAGLRALQDHDAAIEKWLRDEVVPPHEAVRSGRMKTHSGHEVREHLAGLHARTVAKRQRAG